MKKIKMIIFDLDDTLVSTYKTEYKIVKKAAYISYGIKITKKQFNIFYGISNFNLQMSKMLNRSNIEEFLNYFNNLLKNVKYKQIISIKQIERLKKNGVIIGVITNSRKSKVIKKMSNELIERLDFIFSIEDLKEAKPNADIVKKVIYDYGITSQECVCVGDSNTDYYFALNGNIKFYKVNTGLNKEALNVLNFRNVNRFISFFIKERNKKSE